LGWAGLRNWARTGAAAREEKEKPFYFHFQMYSSSKLHFEPQKLIFKK
jgi:hypothetical protein